MNRRDGYRYIRSYQTKAGERWALWQVIHGKARRVGTAETDTQWLEFLGLSRHWYHGWLAGRGQGA